MADQPAAGGMPDSGGIPENATDQQAEGGIPEAGGQDVAGLKSALQVEREARKSAEARAKANAEAAAKLQQIEESQKSEQQKLADRLAQAERERDDAVGRNLRFEVAAAKGVPADLADMLRGGTREELEAAADALLKHLAPQGRRTTAVSQVAGNGSNDGGTGQKPRDIFASLMKGG